MDDMSIDSPEEGANSVHAQHVSSKTIAPNTASSHHPRPFTDHPTATKRRRPNPSPSSSLFTPRTVLTLQDVPIEAVTVIIRYLHPTEFGRFSSGLTPIAHIRNIAPLRTLNHQFRDAFDAHVLSLDLSDVTLSCLTTLFKTLLPRLHNLSYMSLSFTSLTIGMRDAWMTYLAGQPRLQHLMFVHPNPANPHADFAIDPTIPRLITQHCKNTLERITTNSDDFLGAVGAVIGPHSHNVRELQLQMDDISERRLLSFKSLKSLKILYRVALSAGRAQNLVEVLQACQNPVSDLHVHLRLNKLSSSFFRMFPHVQGLKKISLFDGMIEEHNRGIEDLAACPKLEQVHFEWYTNLSGRDIAELANGMRMRLKKLLIWNCEDVTDEGLIAVARLCPNAEVELRFARDQFSHTALSLLGDRVSWFSTV